MDSSRDTSPDPITLPSSPLGRPRRQRHTGVKRASQRPPSMSRSSPSKSFFMDTGAARGESPWRIKVTVEAEPNDEISPSRNTARTTSVPVQGLRSSILAKTSHTHQIPALDEQTGDIRPPRKRKGTPIGRPAKRYSSKPGVEGEESMVAKTGQLPPPTPSTDGNLYITSPTHSGSSSTKRKALRIIPTLRSKRLSQARQELDQALQDAVGHSRSGDSRVLSSPSAHEVPGDMTVSMSEDMTMVLPASLESYKNNLSRVSHGREVEVSHLRVSYLPSSPPEQALYPDLTRELEKPRTEDVVPYDPMSWKPTTLAKNFAQYPRSPPPRPAPEQRLDSEPSHWARERQAMSKQIRHTDTSRVIVIDDTRVVTEQSGDIENQVEAGANLEEEDIWQEEASKLLDDAEQLRPSHLLERQGSQTPTFDDLLFAGQPARPLRGKIPKTWRRSSGIEFSYVDSPAPPKEAPHNKSAGEGSAEEWKPSTRAYHSRGSSGADTDAGGRSGGVLTPPSSEDETKNDERQAGSSELTEPDAAATQLEHTRLPLVEAHQSHEESSADTSAADTSASGLFWNRGTRPARPRYRGVSVARVPDLSDLFDFASSSPAKQPISPERPQVVASHCSVDGSGLQQIRCGNEALSSSEVEESFQSKASDQRQLLVEMQSARKVVQSATRFQSLRLDLRGTYGLKRHEPDQEMEEEDGDDDDEMGVEDEEGDNVLPRFRDAASNASKEKENLDDDISSNDELDMTAEPTPSYEECLNLDSPQTIKVRFNDSAGNSSLLAPTKEYKPLFGSDRVSAPKPPAILGRRKTVQALVATGTVPQLPRYTISSGSDLLSRLSKRFWTSLLPSGPTFIEHQPPYPSALRTIIRERYSVVPNVFPWTMIHMKTLHRMLNSCTSGLWDSVIPKPGSAAPISSTLLLLIGEELESHNSGPFEFSHQHAHVVAAFMQVLVSKDIVDAMERGDIEWLGDPDMARYRKIDGLGRGGNDILWPSITGETWWSKGGVMDEMFVAKALMDCAYDNVLICKERGWTNPGLGR